MKNILKSIKQITILLTALLLVVSTFNISTEQSMAACEECLTPAFCTGACLTYCGALSVPACATALSGRVLYCTPETGLCEGGLCMGSNCVWVPIIPITPAVCMIIYTTLCTPWCYNNCIDVCWSTGCTPGVDYEDCGANNCGRRVCGSDCDFLGSTCNFKPGNECFGSDDCDEGETCQNCKCVSDCTCGSWSNRGCGYSTCTAPQMGQTRSCNPDNCDSEFRCVNDSCTSWSSIGCGQNGCSANQMYKTRNCTYDCLPESECVDDLSCTSPSCSCTAWTNSVCGGGSCSASQMGQTRSCTPDLCLSESRCVSDSCTAWTNAGCGQNGCSANQMYRTRNCTYDCLSESQCIGDPSCEPALICECDGSCNGLCPSGTDPDCNCTDNDGCCGVVGCSASNDNDCPFNWKWWEIFPWF